jgi:hypothetical protein
MPSNPRQASRIQGRRFCIIRFCHWRHLLAMSKRYGIPGSAGVSPASCKNGVLEKCVFVRSTTPALHYSPAALASNWPETPALPNG